MGGFLFAFQIGGAKLKRWRIAKVPGSGRVHGAAFLFSSSCFSATCAQARSRSVIGQLKENPDR